MAGKRKEIKPRDETEPKSATVSGADRVVLVGTYKGDILARWPKWYCYPLRVKDSLSEADAAKINELWLFKGKTEQKNFKAEFVGLKARDELVRDYGYPAVGKAHGERYLLFKKTLVYHTNDVSPEDAERVFVRTADFARSPGVRKQLKEYLESPDRSDPNLAKRLPMVVTHVPRENLCVCESSFLLESSYVASQPVRDSEIPRGDAHIDFGDSLSLCEKWSRPTVIVSDGPYGLNSYPGDPETPEGLADFYRPFLLKWHELALPSATLWFWNSEQGWANCHREIEACGWEFRNCHVWDKGISHVAGNCNTQTIRKYPVVTEVCVQYVRKNTLVSGERSLPIRDWLRSEWKRTGLPFSLTNEACGVKGAATRKYFTQDRLLYFPPPEAFVRIAAYANAHGRSDGAPYFAKPDGGAYRLDEWELMRAKFHCEVGVSNVWHMPAVRGRERIKKGTSCLHMNQKPLALLEQLIRSTSDVGDVVWEPFGGLCSASVAAIRTGRLAFASEINREYYDSAKGRIRDCGVKIFHQDTTDMQIRAALERLRKKVDDVSESEQRRSLLKLVDAIECHVMAL